MSNVALNAVSVTLGVFFVFFGCLKLAPILSEELYRDMGSRVYPFSGFFKLSPNPHFIRRVYGSLELVGGTLLVSCPGTMRDVSNIMLLLLMLFDLYSVWMLEEGLKEASHAIVFGLLLTCRIIIRVQVYQRNQQIAKECMHFVNKHMNMHHSKNCKYDQIISAAAKFVNDGNLNDSSKTVESLIKSQLGAEDKKSI